MGARAKAAETGMVVHFNLWWDGSRGSWRPGRALNDLFFTSVAVATAMSCRDVKYRQTTNGERESEAQTSGISPCWGVYRDLSVVHMP